MKTNIRLAIIIAVLISFLANVFLYKMMNQWKWESARHESNYQALLENSINDRNGYASTLKLTRKQLFELRGHIIDSLDRLTKDKLKPSRIKSYAHVNIKKDTKNVPVQWRDSLVYVRDTVIKGRTLKFNDTCVNVTVYEPVHPDSSQFAYITTAIDISADLVVYKGKRTKQFSIFGWNIFKYGPREDKAQIFTNCGSVKLEHIEIVD